jgi:hypothetical protein
MTLNIQYQKLKYIEGIKDRLRRFYSISDTKSDHRKMLSHEIDGYMEAGLLAEIIDKRELQSVIDEQHIAVFGISRQERRLEMNSILETAPDNWDIYDTPAIDRRQT